MAIAISHRFQASMFSFGKFRLHICRSCATSSLLALATYLPSLVAGDRWIVIFIFFFSAFDVLTFVGMLRDFPQL